MRPERLDRHRDGEVGFAGAGGADAEHDCILSDCREVVLLPDGARPDGLPRNGIAHGIGGQLPDLLHGVVRDHADDIAHGLVGEAGALLDIFQQDIHSLRRFFDIRLRAGDLDAGAAVDDHNMKLLLNHVEVCIIGSEYCGDLIGIGRIPNTFCHAFFLLKAPYFQIVSGSCAAKLRTSHKTISIIPQNK